LREDGFEIEADIKHGTKFTDDNSIPTVTQVLSLSLSHAIIFNWYSSNPKFIFALI